MIHNFLVAIVLVIVAASFAGRPSPRNRNSESRDPVEFASENRERIRNGIDAGAALGEALKEGNFRKSLQKLGTNIASFLGVLGPLASIALSFIPTGDSPELILMKEKFKQVNSKLDVITAEFEEVKNAIGWSAVTVSYGNYERKIKAAEANLNRIYDHEGSVREQEKDYFIKQYDNDFSNSLQTLYYGIMTKDSVISPSILNNARIHTKNHKRKFEKFSLGLVQLLVQGIIVRISYSAMKEQETQHLVEEWDRKMLALKLELQVDSDEIKSGYLTQLRSDAQDMIRRSSGLSNKKLMQQLYEFVNEKYDWRYFYVAVYDNLVGDDKNYVSVCGDTGLTFFDQNDKNVVIASQDKLWQPRHSQQHRRRMMNSVGLDVGSCRVGMRVRPFRAKGLVNNIHAKEEFISSSLDQAMKLNQDYILGIAIPTCSPNQLYLAVEIHDDFYSSYPEGHVDMERFEGLINCLCPKPGDDFTCLPIPWNHKLIHFE